MFIDTVKEILSSLVDGVKFAMEKLKEQRPSQKWAVKAGIGLTVFTWVAGPNVFPFAVGAIVVNSMFWWLVKDSPAITKFISNHGATIDMTITVGSFFIAGTFSAWMMMMMATAYFTIFRKILFPESDEKPSIFSRIKGWLSKGKKALDPTTSVVPPVFVDDGASI
jgi:hypothetical protein